MSALAAISKRFKKQTLWIKSVRLGGSSTGVLLEDGGSNALKVGGVTFSATELGFLDGVTAGTVTASKAMVVDASRDITGASAATAVRNLRVTNLDAGISGTAGSVDIFPATASKGKATFDVTDQTGDTTVTHRTAAMGQATVITTPDPGAAAASVVLTEGAQTINGAKTIPDLNIGASGTAGVFDIFPATASRGKATWDVTNQTGDTTVTHRTAAMGQATVITTPDPGAAAASVVLTEGTQTINGAKTFGSVPILTGQEYQLTTTPKVGATAGWSVNAADNLGELATLPQNQTGSTIVLRVSGLKVGWTVTAFKVEAQVESAGNTVTIDADLRKLTNAAADPADASIGTITQVSVTADTKVEAAKTGLAEVVAADEWLYILITATTGATTDIRLLGCTVTVTEG